MKKKKIILILVVVLVVFVIFQYIDVKKDEGKMDQEELELEKELTHCSKIEFTGDIADKIIDQSLKDLIIQDTIGPEHKAWLEDYFCRSDSLWDCCGKEIDLNNDGISEYIIFPTAFYEGEESVMTLRGASGNGDVLIYGFFEQGWKLIGNLTGSSFVERFKANYTKGYLNLTIYIPMGVRALYIDEWEWNGEKYELKEKLSRLHQKPEESTEEFNLKQQKVLDKIGKINNNI